MHVAAEQSFAAMAKRIEEAVRPTQPGEDTKPESRATESMTRAVASRPTQSELAGDTAPKAAEPVFAPEFEKGAMTGYKRLANLTAEPAQVQPEENVTRRSLAESAPKLDAQSATAANGCHGNESARKARRLSATEQASPGGIEAFAAAEDRVDAPNNAPKPAAPQADAKRVYERERAAAYRDFYQELEIVGQLTVAQAVSHKPILEAVAEIAKVPSDSSHAPPSPFERVLFRLYERIIVAYNRSLVDAHLPTSTVIQRLSEHAELVYQEIYVARIDEFSQRAGFYAEKALPEVYLGLLPQNARGQTSRLFRQLEDEILAMAGSTSVGGDASPQWAVCPSFSAGDLAVIKEPLLFPSEARAQGWLDEVSIFVHEWNHDQADDSKSRDEWLQGIASMWIGSEHTTLPRLKRVPVMPAELGDNVYVCSLQKWVRRACKDVIGLPIPVHKLEDDAGPGCPLRLSSLLDPDHLDPDPAEFDELLEMATVGDVDSRISCLAQIGTSRVSSAEPRPAPSGTTLRVFKSTTCGDSSAVSYLASNNN